MSKIFIVGVDCSVSQAIRYALKGTKFLCQNQKMGNQALN